MTTGPAQKAFMCIPCICMHVGLGSHSEGPLGKVHDLRSLVIFAKQLMEQWMG